MSEDYGFCRLWRSIGGRVWVDPAIQLAHIGHHIYTGDPMELFSTARRGQRRVTYELSTALPHLTSTDVAELERLLRAVFKDDVGAANRWLSSYSKYFRAKPIELIKRDVVGVVRVISYLKDAAS